MLTLANREDPNEMPHNHQSLFGNYNLSMHTMEHSKLNVSNQKEESISI